MVIIVVLLYLEFFSDDWLYKKPQNVHFNLIYIDFIFIYFIFMHKKELDL